MKNSVGQLKFSRHKEIDVAESIFSEIFTTGSRIDVLTTHAQTLSSQKSPKWCSAPEMVFIGKRVHVMNSNMASDFKPGPKLRKRTEQSP